MTTLTTTDTKHSADSLDATTDVAINEHLSALLDDEVGSFEQKRVLNELSSDDAMRDKLARYSLIGETLRSGRSAVTADASFLAGIQDQLTSEPAYSETVLQDQLQARAQKQDNSAKNDGSWLRPVGGFAMAASVAALAVIGFQNYIANPDSAKPTTEMVATNAIQSDKASAVIVTNNTNADANVSKENLTQAEMESAVVVPADKLVAKNTTSSNNDYAHADLQTRNLLKRYVDSHMQYASTTAFVPSVRVIAYSDY